MAALGRASVAVGLLLSAWLMAAGTARAQDSRYVGRAAGRINSDGDPPPSDDSCAGTVGSAAPGTNPCNTSKVCDMTVGCCFNEPDGCDETPCDQANTGPASCTVGGAQDSLHVDRPGFPRSFSFARGATIPLGPVLIITSDATATADSFDSTLTTTSGPSLVFLNGTMIGAVPPGETSDFVLFSIQSGRERRTIKDGLATISIDAAICKADAGFEAFCGNESEVILGHAEAGVEIPFTSGGGGCSLAPGRRSTGGGMLIGVLALLWQVARRRRRAP